MVKLALVLLFVDATCVSSQIAENPSWGGQLDNSDLDSMNQLHELRFTQENAAFEKCFNALNTASSNEVEVTKRDYLDFLGFMTDGNVNVNDFSDVDIALASIFYLAACPFSSCEGEGAGSVMLGTSGEALGTITGLCSNILSYLTTSTMINFEVWVEFDPSNVAKEDIGGCLESAVQNTLWDGLDCDLALERRLGGTRDGYHHHNCITVRSADGFEAKPRKGDSTRWSSRQDAAEPFKDPFSPTLTNMSETMPGARHLDTLPGCSYDVTAMVVSSTFIICPARPDMLCGLAMLNTTIQASQHSAPFEDELRAEAEQLLTTAVSEDTFEGFLPPECL